MKQIKLIGVCLSTIHEEDRFNFVKELNKYAVANDYRLIVFNSCADLYEQSPTVNEASSAVFNLIPYDRLSALVLFPNIMYNSNIVDDVISKCHAYNIPVISMDREIEGCITFSFSNSDVFEQLCRHIIEVHKARKIYMIAGFKGNVYSEERIAAFRRALEAFDIPFDPNNIGYGCFWEVPALEVLNKWFIEEKREIPDAIVCANDFMAITASSFLQSIGVKIPEDCIITGFDGIKQAEYLPPNLTTCKQDFDKMCSLIMDTIIRLDKGEKVSGSFYVDFNIVYSQSCGCEKTNFDKVTVSIQSLLTQLRLSDERQKMLCSTQAYIPNVDDINFLPRVIMDKFRIDTCIFAVNENIFFARNPDLSRIKNELFSDRIRIIFHRYGETELEQCIVPPAKLLPRYDLLLNNTDPIIVCCANFTDMVMGYCVFQPQIDREVYNKLHVLMSTVDSALGSFYSKIQINSMNEKLVEANDDLQRLSQSDYMTGLYNRRGFFKKLDKRLNAEANFGSTLVIISVDLDELKYINDNFGHAEGDNAIFTISRALTCKSEKNEIYARFGGDEFCVASIIPDDAERYFDNFNTRLQSYLDSYNLSSNKKYKVIASIGYSSSKIYKNLNTDKMIKMADEKMYACKAEHKRK